jgi:hypothetical protein
MRLPREAKRESLVRLTPFPPLFLPTDTPAANRLFVTLSGITVVGAGLSVIWSAYTSRQVPRSSHSSPRRNRDEATERSTSPSTSCAPPAAWRESPVACGLSCRVGWENWSGSLAGALLDSARALWWPAVEVCRPLTVRLPVSRGEAYRACLRQAEAGSSNEPSRQTGAPKYSPPSRVLT